MNGEGMHYITICKRHRMVIRQCRCPGDKVIRTMPCPGKQCEKSTLQYSHDGNVIRIPKCKRNTEICDGKLVYTDEGYLCAIHFSGED
jgi:hypothetical protein